MKTRFYFCSEDTGFYILPGSSFVPKSSIEITAEQYAKYAGVAWPENKVLGVCDDGNLAWLDAPQLSYEEKLIKNESQKQKLISIANEYINSKQWPGKAAIGRLKSEELVQYHLWLDYLDEVIAIDTSSETDIICPKLPK